MYLFAERIDRTIGNRNGKRHVIRQIMAAPLTRVYCGYTMAREN